MIRASLFRACVTLSRSPSLPVRWCYSIHRDHSHLLKFLGRNAGRRQIEKILLSGAVQIDFSPYVSSGLLTDRCPIKRVYVNQLAANNPIEDRWNMGFTQVDGIVSSCLFTVLDGHSGTACVHTLAWSLLDYVAAAFLDTRKLETALDHWRTHNVDQPYHLARRLDLLAASDHRRLGHAAIPPTKQLLSHMRHCLWEYVNELVKRGDRNMDPTSCLTDALVRLDHDLCSMGAREQQIVPPSLGQHPVDEQLSRELMRTGLSGSVGCVGRLYWSNQDHRGNKNVESSASSKGNPVELHLANVGDCGVVLLREKETGSSSEFPVLEAIPCTKPHQGATNPSEIARVTMEHPENLPTEIFREGGRLLGELAPSRAFGDVRYKWPVERLLELNRYLNKTSSTPRADGMLLPFEKAILASPLPRPYTSPPYLTAKPEISRYQLTPQDRYIVLATDGLWDMLSTADTARILEAELAKPSCPATRLLWNCLSAVPPDMARALGSRNRAFSSSKRGENPTAQSERPRRSRDEELDRKSFDRAFRLLSLPPGVARYHRDDITVMVLELFDRP